MRSSKTNQSPISRAAELSAQHTGRLAAQISWRIVVQKAVYKLSGESEGIEESWMIIIYGDDDNILKNKFPGAEGTVQKHVDRLREKTEKIMW